MPNYLIEVKHDSKWQFNSSIFHKKTNLDYLIKMSDFLRLLIDSQIMVKKKNLNQIMGNIKTDIKYFQYFCFDWIANGGMLTMTSHYMVAGVSNFIAAFGRFQIWSIFLTCLKNDPLFAWEWLFKAVCHCSSDFFFASLNSF